MSDYPETDEQELEAAMQLHRRQISTETIKKFEDYAAEIFTALGMDLNTPATQDTPRRFIRALVDITAGYEGDPKLLKVFATECRGEPDCRLSQVVEGPIPFVALCEHHALPFYGQAYIGYIAHEHIIGISKLTRLVRLFARRFAVQERIGRQIADALKVQVSDFFGTAPVQHVRLSGEEDQLLQAFRSIKNAEMRGCILKLVGNVNKRVK